MIFIGLFLAIALIVISLNYHNHSNLDKIEEHLKNSNCKEYIYSRGSYKALCENSFVDISNSFYLDIDKNSYIIKYEDIKDIQSKETKLFINDFVLEFKDKNDLNLFLEKLEDKLNK